MCQNDNTNLPLCESVFAQMQVVGVSCRCELDSGLEDGFLIEEQRDASRVTVRTSRAPETWDSADYIKQVTELQRETTLVGRHAGSVPALP